MISRIFFYLLILLLPTQLGAHFWPSWAMVLGRRVDYLAPTVYLTDILIIFIIGTYLLRLSFPRKRESIMNINMDPRLRGDDRVTNFQFIKKNWLLLTAGSLFIVANIFFAADRPVAVYKWLKVAEFVLFGWYVIKTKPNLSLISYLLSLTIIYSSVIAIAQFLLQHSVGGIFWWLGERTFDINAPGIARTSWCLFNFSCRQILRPYGTFPHPNVLAGFLVVSLPVIIYQFTNLPISQWKKIFYLITLIAGLVALFFTFSRSAWTIGLLTLGALIIINVKVMRPLLFGMTAIFIVGLFFLISNHSSLLEESFVVRDQLNKAAIVIFRQSPFVGVGLGNFLVKLPEMLPSRQIYFLQPVHNIYLLLLSEIGLIGVIGIIGVIRVIRWRKINKKWLIPLLSLLLLGFVDHYPLSLQQGQLLLTLFLALSFC